MNSSPLPIFSLALAAAGLAMFSLTDLHAASLALETFDTAATPPGASIQGTTGGTGWRNGWATSNQSNGYLFTTRNTTPLTYAGYNSTTTPAASGNYYENLASGFGGNQTTSVQRGLDTSAGGTFGSAGLVTAGTIGANNTTVWGSFLYSNDTSGNAANTTLSFRLLGAGTFATNLSQPATSNLLIFKIDYGTNYLTSDTVTFWTNPDLATFNGISGGTTSALGNYSFTDFQAQTTYGAGSGSQSSIDDIRFGSSLGDVAPAAATAVPEPAAWLATALLVLAAARKFRLAELRNLLGFAPRLAA